MRTALIPIVLFVVGIALVAYDLWRRSSPAQLTFPSPEQVTIEEPGEEPQTLSWSELSVYEPSISGTLSCLGLFLGAIWGSIQAVWSFVSSDSLQRPESRTLVMSLTVFGWLAAFSASVLIERTQWVELRLPAPRGASYFSHRSLQALGALSGLRSAPKIARTPLGSRLIEKIFGR